MSSFVDRRNALCRNKFRLCSIKTTIRFKADTKYQNGSGKSRIISLYTYPSDNKDVAIEPENDKNLANSDKDSNYADQDEMQPVIE